MRHTQHLNSSLTTALLLTSASVHLRVEGAFGVAVIDAGALFASQSANVAELPCVHGSLGEEREASEAVYVPTLRALALPNQTPTQVFCSGQDSRCATFGWHW